LRERSPVRRSRCRRRNSVGRSRQSKMER
jgi:hypothetical protein